MLDGYDVIVVGSGAGGGVTAGVLAEAGKRVLLLERGEALTYANDGQRDHLRNHRLSLYGHNTGPESEGNPRVFVSPSGEERTVRPHEGGYNNIASCVGSGTFVYGAMAWRFLPDDFRMATRYGVPAGSSLCDWPMSYDDLEPWYDRAEWELGVAGNDNENAHQGQRRRGYPMPAVSKGAGAAVLQRGAKKLGVSTFTPPFLINTKPYNNRPACIECGSCVGFPCPNDSKTGSQNTMIPRAIKTGLCDLFTGATAERIDTDDCGNVIGVTYVRNGQRVSVRAKQVVVSCSAVESARLLLLSKSRHHPAGLGNAHDQVGRHLQGHYYPTIYGLMEEQVYTPKGPGVTLATCHWNHGNPGVIGGAMLADDFIMVPVIFWKNALPPGTKRWGTEAKEFMRRNYTRVMQIKGPVHEIPDPDCRVQLDEKVRDHLGLPVARLSGTTHQETVNTAAFMWEKARDWVVASGAVKTWGGPPGKHLSAGQHQAGTCRMGNDPKTSVTDAWGRVHGHDNLFVADGSLHPTNGGFNPVLTIMTLALRNAHAMAGH